MCRDRLRAFLSPMELTESIGKVQLASAVSTRRISTGNVPISPVRLRWDGVRALTGRGLNGRSATPIEVAPLEELWELFLRHANIILAPKLSLPVIQRPLL
jgi:hypothetical protein